MIAHRNEVSRPPASVLSLSVRFVWFVVLVMAAAAGLPNLIPSAYAMNGQVIANNTPGYVSSATNLGAEDTSKTIEVSIWLQPHNRSALDALAQDLYNPNSPHYRRWLKASEIATQFAPTPAETKTVQDFFQSNNLTVVSLGPNNFFVRARGTVASVESAFHVQLNRYQVGNKTFRANATDPYIDGPAGAVVQAVSGLDDGAFEHRADLQPAILQSASSSVSNQEDSYQVAPAADPDLFETACFTAPEIEKYTTGGSYPKSTIKGNGYNSGAAGCGYSPANLYDAYNLTGLYAEGYNGAGQTIVIMDWCGSPTITEDANTFSKKFGLPKLTSSNFNIIDYPGPSDCSGVDPQINLEVEWAHAIAPGANIDLIIAADGSYEDVDEATYYAVTSGLGSVISGGYFTPEFSVSSAEANKENLISEMAAVAGIATNYASTEWQGNFTHSPQLFVSMPADLPYATGVGGVSLALNSDNSIAFQTDWEGWQSLMFALGQVEYPSPRTTSPSEGAAGGPSVFFSKPSFQKGVPGKWRQEPDISWLADPLTGVVMVVTQPSQYPPQVWYVSGGVGLSTPMFSALWAIANEEAGTALGQAAPYLYSMPSTTITDIVPYGSAHDVTEVIAASSSQSSSYDAKATMGVSWSSTFAPFYSAIWDGYTGNENYAFAFSFGGDSDLKSKVGWDEVTGLGTPDAQAFADWFAPSKK